MRIAETLQRLIGPVELIHEQAGPRLLRLTRLGIFALWILKLSLDPLWRLAELPREMFQPVGVLNLLSPGGIDLLLRPNSLCIFLGVTLVVTALAMMHRWFLATSMLAAILLTVYSSIIRSFGPAVHTDIVLLLAVYALTGFAWADFYQARFGKAASGTDCRFNCNSYPLITIVALLCISYCMVGLNRVVSGGASVFAGETMEAWAIDASLRGYYFNTNIGWHIPEWPVALFFLQSGLPVITLFEILAPLCLVMPRFRWVFIPVMVSFHLLSLVFMNIFFFDDMFCYLLLVDWSRRFPALAKEKKLRNY
jgi:hypothetical protein